LQDKDLSWGRSTQTSSRPVAVSNNDRDGPF